MEGNEHNLETEKILFPYMVLVRDQRAKRTYTCFDDGSQVELSNFGPSRSEESKRQWETDYVTAFLADLTRIRRLKTLNEVPQLPAVPPADANSQDKIPTELQPSELCSEALVGQDGGPSSVSVEKSLFATPAIENPDALLPDQLSSRSRSHPSSVAGSDDASPFSTGTASRVASVEKALEEEEALEEEDYSGDVDYVPSCASSHSLSRPSTEDGRYSEETEEQPLWSSDTELEGESDDDASRSELGCDVSEQIPDESAENPSQQDDAKSSSWTPYGANGCSGNGGNRVSTERPGSPRTRSTYYSHRPGSVSPEL